MASDTARAAFLALLELAEEITSLMDENEFTSGVFIDLSKSFDTVLLKNRSNILIFILVKKLFN